MRKAIITLAILVSISLLGMTDANAQNLDSLLGVWNNKSQPDSNRVQAYKDYIWKGSLFSKPDSAAILAEALHGYAKKHKYPNASATGYNLQGIAHAVQGNYPRALEYYEKSLAINEELGDKSAIASSLGNIGNVYNNQADYPRALEYFEKSLAIQEELGDKNGIANTLSNIGIIYSSQSNYPRALEYHEKGLAIKEEIGNKKGIAGSLNNIGTIYQQQGNYPRALEYYVKSLAIKEELGDKNGIANTLNNIGNIYKVQGNYPRALEYYEMSLVIYEELGNKNGSAANLINIGFTYGNQGKNTLALSYCQKGLALADEIGALEWQKNACQCLYTSYKAMGNSDKALQYYELMIVARDSIFNEANTKKLVQIDMQYEFNRKEAAAKAEQDKKDAVALQEVQRQKLVRNGFIAGVIVFIILFLIAFLRFREKKKLSDKLAIQKSEIENQKLLVEEKNEQIYASIRYASTIQNAILPWEATLGKAFTDFMIFFKPKDIVSGDSYWFKEVDGVKFLAVIDCTGHGIPGSMLTVIASSVLDDAVLGKRLKKTGEILTYMNDKVTEVLNQRLKENEVRDGMEVALIAINAHKVQFSGAGRPLYMKNDTFEILKTDRRGIAGRAEDDNYVYTSLEIERSNNLLLYLTTDGFADQMNEDGKKFSTRRFLALLESIADKPLSEQYRILNNELAAHQGTRNQIDDITIIGVRI